MSLTTRCRFALAMLAALVAGCATPPATPGPRDPGPTTLATAPDRFFTDGDVTLRYREIGSGAPVVLIHGYSNRLERWAGIADSLARNRRVIAVDARGFGGSSKFADPDRYGPEMAHDLARLLDHLGLPRAHLVGHSMGAVLAANLARLRPSRVATLTLVAAPLFPDSLAAVRFFEPHIPALLRGEGLAGFLRANYPAWSDSTVQRTNREVMPRNDVGALVAVMRSFPRLTLAAGAGAQRSIPTLVLIGTGDPFLEYNRRFAREWPGARLVEVAGADHSSILAHPTFLAEARTHLR